MTTSPASVRKASARNHFPSGANQASVLPDRPVSRTSRYSASKGLPTASGNSSQIARPTSDPTVRSSTVAPGRVDVPEPPVRVEDEQRPVHALDGLDEQVTGRRGVAGWRDRPVPCHGAHSAASTGPDRYRTAG